MDGNTLENVREAVHFASLGLFVITATIGFIGAIKPGLFRKLFKEFAERKYIIATSVFICLLSASVFTATQSLKTPYQSVQGATNTSGDLEKPNRQITDNASSQDPNSSGATDPDAPIGATQETAQAKPQTGQTSSSTRQVAQGSTSQGQASAAAQKPPQANNQPNPPAQPSNDKCRVKLLNLVCL